MATELVCPQCQRDPSAAVCADPGSTPAFDQRPRHSLRHGPGDSLVRGRVSHCST